jgi:transcriptional regulator with XRE-family HTH domain
LCCSEALWQTARTPWGVLAGVVSSSDGPAGRHCLSTRLRLTCQSSGQPKACFAAFSPPLTSTLGPMNTAQRIRENRIRLALTEAGLAEELGLTIAAYGDLETHQDELATCVTLEQATKLSLLLHVPLLELLSEHKPPEALPLPTEVANVVSAHINASGVSVESLEESIGWELRAFLEEPSRIAPSLPVMFFQALAGAIHALPLSLIPRVA